MNMTVADKAELQELTDEILSLRAEKRSVEKREKEVKEDLERKIADLGGAVELVDNPIELNCAKLSWKTNWRFDVAKFKEDNHETYMQYQKASEYLDVRAVKAKKKSIL